MSNILKTISLDGFSKNVMRYQAGEGITFTADPSDSTLMTIAAVAADLSNYYTKSETYSKTEVDEMIEAIEQFSVKVVDTLPASGEAKTIYLVPKDPAGESGNVRDEYMWINNAWEKIGDTAVDLTDYYTKTQTDALLDEKQDKLTAGENIEIASDGTISATDTTYEDATQSKSGLMSAADKTKLDGIEDGAEENVQSDWNVTDTTSDAYIKNKPTNATTTADGFMSKEDKAKLDGIEDGAEVNVQADWNQTDTTADDYIKNKPTNATQTTDGFMSKEDKVKLDGIEEGAEVNVQSDWNQTDSSADDYIKNKPGNATQTADGFMSKEDKKKLDDMTPDDYLTCETLGDCPTITTIQTDITDIKTNKLDATKAAVLDALGYEEVELSMTDTDGNSITKTILAKKEDGGV